MAFPAGFSALSATPKAVSFAWTQLDIFLPSVLSSKTDEVQSTPDKAESTRGNTAWVPDAIFQFRLSSLYHEFHSVNIAVASSFGTFQMAESILHGFEVDRTSRVVCG